ncbi:MULTISPECIES: hypothetical protein [Arsenophonus]|jgi:hypothetical protein|uniref:hypothetical protein n=1 Tax=Arsenophonus TaxID=637 RepID=UPI0015D7D750|nr:MULTISPECIES: hypothetical protein [Arsenophonus]UBX28771.1 hypothetical protein LDL57_13445 [Arsenophonus apicola]
MSAVVDDIGFELSVALLCSCVRSISVIWLDIDTVLIEIALVPSKIIKINGLDNSFIMSFPSFNNNDNYY